MIDWNKPLQCAGGDVVSVRDGAWGDFKVVIITQGMDQIAVPVSLEGQPLGGGSDLYTISNREETQTLASVLRSVREEGSLWATDSELSRMYRKALIDLGWTPPKGD